MLTAILRPVGIASAALLSALGLLSRKSRRARFAYHLTLYAGTLGIMSVWGVVVSVAATLIGQRFNINYIVARSFYHTASPLIGIRLRVEGEEHLAQLSSGKGPDGKEQSAVLVGNHQSFLDILYLGRIFPRRASIMAKRELIYAPLLGQYLAASGAVFVNRKSKTHALAAMAKAGEKMKRRGYPDCSRTYGEIPPTYIDGSDITGAFHLAVQAQVPIVPVVCENYHRLFDGRTRMDRGTLTLRVLPPIPTTGLTSDDVTSLTESTHAQMLEALIDISQPGPSSAKVTLASSISSSEKGRIHPIDTSAASEVKTEAEAEAEGEEEGSSGQDTPTSAAWSYTSAGTTGDAPDGLEGAEGQEGQGTEDEMDSEEDAVLLRRPKESIDKLEADKDTRSSP